MRTQKETLPAQGSLVNTPTYPVGGGTLVCAAVEAAAGVGGAGAVAAAIALYLSRTNPQEVYLRDAALHREGNGREPSTNNL